MDDIGTFMAMDRGPRPASAVPRPPTDGAPTVSDAAPLMADGTQPALEVDAAQVAAARAELAALEGNFERCLAGVRMHFQPIVHTADYRIFAYEACSGPPIGRCLTPARSSMPPSASSACRSSAA
jgi:hypothetical protein